MDRPRGPNASSAVTVVGTSTAPNPHVGGDEMSPIHRALCNSAANSSPRGPPEEYERLRQVQAHLAMLRISRLLQNCGLTAAELGRTAREELEARQ